MEPSVLNVDIMIQKGVFWTMGDIHILVSHPIISSIRIKVIEG